jgi:hypothetical protein
MVRGVIDGNEVEQQFPIYSPWVRNVQVLSNHKRRLRTMYWMRGRPELIPRGPSVFEENKFKDVDFVDLRRMKKKERKEARR